ncbi:MAG: 60S ribosomal export protein NMD3, partial [Peptococcaceae bacterium]|nr:60S ribosomal export protein NMD3 [Peptococcaceae bacterium]
MDAHRIANTLSDIGQAAVETLFPRKSSCLFCGRYWPGGKLTAGLCPQCLLEWRRFRAKTHICPLCGSFDGGDPCGGPCEGRGGRQPDMAGSLTAIHAAAPYAGIYRQRIMAFKYNGKKHMA